MSPRANARITRSFSSGVQPAVQQRDAEVRETPPRPGGPPSRSRRAGPPSRSPRPADRRCRPAAPPRAARARTRAPPSRCDSGRDRRHDGLRPGRQVANHRDVEVAVGRQRQRPRNRRRRHHEHVRRQPLGRSSARCTTPKRCCSSMITRPSALKRDGLLHQRVRADHAAARARARSPRQQRRGARAAGVAAGQQRHDGSASRCQQAPRASGSAARPGSRSAP